VKEDIGSKLSLTAGGRFLLVVVVIAIAGDSAIPATAHSAAARIPVDPRTFDKPELPFCRVDIVRRS